MTPPSSDSVLVIFNQAFFLITVGAICSITKGTYCDRIFIYLPWATAYWGAGGLYLALLRGPETSIKGFGNHLGC